MRMTHHEALYRSPGAMKKLRGKLITICGAGALGANLTENLARAGVDTIRVIDHDRIEEHNLSTQPYLIEDVGARKAATLAHALYRAVGVELDDRCKTLDANTIKKLLNGSALVVDCFDNGPSRKLVTEHCLQHDLACLHAGMADGFGEVIWNEDYRVPSGGGDDICDYPLARNLAVMTATITAETILRHLIDGTKENWSFTLADLSLRPMQMR